MIGLLFVVLGLSLLLAALLSAGEAALTRVTRAALGDAKAEAHLAAGLKAENREDHAEEALALLEKPGETFAAIALVRILAEVLAVGSATLLIAHWIPGPGWELLTLAGLGLIVGLVVARWSPRSLGNARPLQTSLALSGLLTNTRRLTGWAVRPREGSAAAQDTSSKVPTAAELREFADRVDEDSGLEPEDRELIRSVFELGGTLSREVMVPRTDMVTVHAEMPLAKALSLFMKSGYSRLPVIDDSADDIRGVVYLKDVIRHLSQDPDGAPNRPVTDFARGTLFVPESKPIDDLLREMQAEAKHIAIVIDEYGGVAGLVTIEDVLEELVGEMRDEHDRVEEDETEEVSPGVFRVSARLPVDELGDLFDLRFDDDDVDTAGGLLAKALGMVPLVGSVAEIGGLHLEAETVEGRRKQVATILVSLKADDETSDAPNPPTEGSHD